MYTEWSLLFWNFGAIMGLMVAVWALSVAIKNEALPTRSGDWAL